MARFRLKKGYSEKEFGRVIFKLAGNPGGKEKASLEDELKKMIETPFDSRIDVIYDTSGKIHVVIPLLDMGNYPDNDFASECMGSLSLRGCGS